MGDEIDATATLSPGARADVIGAPPRTVGRYTVDRPLGSGGMGVVFVAHDPDLDRDVALKLVRPRLRPKASADEIAARLLREARAMATLSHENVVTVFDAGTHDGRVYIAMELVHGESLEAWMRRHEEAPLPQIIELFVAAARGLAAAHAAGIVHRDFKPANVLIGDDGRVRVLDFGLAKWVAHTSSTTTAVPLELEGSLSPEHVDLTQAGAVVGTLGYIAPEQLRRGETDARSDQFSFCAALFRALFGRRPFRPKSASDDAAFRAPIRVPREPSRPKWLVDIVLRGLEPDPAKRYVDMNALIRAMQRKRRRRPLWIAVGGAALAAGGLAAVSVAGGSAPRSCEDTADMLADAWGPTDREALASMSTGDAAVRALDGYAARWLAVHQRACASALTLSFDRQLHCLDRRRTALRALVDAILDSGPAAAIRAPAAALELPRPEFCQDVDALAREVTPPVDPKTAVSVNAVRLSIAQTRGLAASGRATDALAVARSALAEASAVDYPPLRAEALAALGQAHDAAGNYNEALAPLKEGYLAATEASHDEVAARTAIKLVYVAGYRLGDHDEGARWGREAEAALERYGSAPELSAALASNLGAMHNSAGRVGTALEHFGRALALRREASGPESLPEALSLSNLAVAQRRMGQLETAEKGLRRAIAIYERNLGPNHPTLAARLHNLGLVREARGDLEEARQLYVRALDLTTAAYGESHPSASDYLGALAGIARREQNWDLAREYLERGLASLEARVGGEHPRVAAALTNLGHIHSGAGAHDKAIEQYRRALTILDARWRPDHPNLVMPLQGLAEALLASREFAAALPVLERALPIADANDQESASWLRFEAAAARWEIGEHRNEQRRAIEDLKTKATPDLLSAIDAWLAEH